MCLALRVFAFLYPRHSFLFFLERSIERASSSSLALVSGILLLVLALAISSSVGTSTFNSRFRLALYSSSKALSCSSSVSGRCDGSSVVDGTRGVCALRASSCVRRAGS